MIFFFSKDKKMYFQPIYRYENIIIVNSRMFKLEYFTNFYFQLSFILLQPIGTVYEESVESDGIRTRKPS